MHHRLPPDSKRRVADGWHVGELPQKIIGDQRLPLRVVLDECLEMSL
jgi:hypothetical protein